VLVVGLLTLGLLSKPTLVTLPFVLLLLDYWPLRRFPRAVVGDVPDPRNSTRVTAQSLLLEKVPLLVLAAACSLLTYVVQATARGSMDHLPLSSRLANAVVSYVAYIGKFLYPAGLAVFYPHPEHALPAWQVAGASLVLAGISAGVLAWRRRHPYLLVGWLWYLGTLVPVIGLVQVGSQAMADRYSYLTQIGLYLAVAWGVAHVARSSSFRRSACGITACLAFVALSACAWRQVSFWKDSETLWTRTLASTSGNYEAHNGLGRALAHRGQATSAIAQYEEALAIKPDYVEAHNNLGNGLADRGQLDAAISQYRAALQTKPDHAEAHNNLGLAIAGLGHIDAAVEHYEQALASKPDFAEAHYNLANALVNRGRLNSAIAHYRSALSARPDFPQAHNNLGTLLARRGQREEAIAQFREALAIAPGFDSARQNLAAVLAEADGS
jgi:protein O-mannosyl-transferase